jgi:hypothetical protein
MSGNINEPQQEPPVPPIDYGAGPRQPVPFPAPRRTRPDGRTAMNGWLYDQTKQIGTRGEVIVVPARRKR